jgi:hypothetical protein
MRTRLFTVASRVASADADRSAVSLPTVAADSNS